MSAEALLEQGDENGDGVLSLSEFRELFRKLGADNEKTATFSVLMLGCSDDEVLRKLIAPSGTVTASPS